MRIRHGRSLHRSIRLLSKEDLFEEDRIGIRQKPEPVSEQGQQATAQ